MLSGYLLHRYLELVLSGGAAAAGVCSTVLHLDCDAALLDPISTQLGLPLAGWGIVYFGALAALLLLRGSASPGLRRAATAATLALSLLGSAVGLVLLAGSALGLVAFCPLCVGVHLVSFALVVSTLRSGGRPFHDLRRGLKAVAAFVFGRHETASEGTRTAALGLLVASLTALVLYQALAMFLVKRKPEEPDPRYTLASFALSHRLALPVTGHEPVLGAADATVRLVVFSDFECPACRTFSRRISGLVEGSRGKVSLVYKHYPASRTCNSDVETDLHPHACAAAWAAEAASLQGRFWPYYDRLFASESLDEAALRRAAAETGLDLPRFEKDRNGGEVRRWVAEDVALGNRLGIEAVPTVYVNGRRAPSIQMKDLHLLVMSELAGQPRPLGPLGPEAGPGDQPK